MNASYLHGAPPLTTMPTGHGITEPPAPQGSWQRFPAVKSIELAKLFCTSLSPFYTASSAPADVNPSFQLTMPTAFDLPGIIRFGGRFVEQILPGSSVAGKLTAALMTVCSTFQVAAAVSDAIPIADSDAFNKIGRDPDHPLDGQYQQTGNMDAQALKPIGTICAPFRGEYDGNGYTINGQGDCLFNRMDGNSTVQNIRISRASITSTDKARPVAVIACSMAGNAQIKSVMVENSRVEIRANNGLAAIGSGQMQGKASITALNAVNTSVSSQGSKSVTAIGAGLMVDDTRIQDVKALNCQIFSEDWVSAMGVGAGEARDNAVIQDITALNCQLHSSGKTVISAIGAGRARNNARIENILAVRCNNTGKATKGVSTRRGSCPVTYVAAGAGFTNEQVVVKNTTALDSQFHAQYGCFAYAAVGVAEDRSTVSVENTEAVNCHITAHTGSLANAAVGVADVCYGDGPKNTMARDCTVGTPRSHDGAAAIGGLLIDAYGRAPSKRVAGIPCNSSREDRFGSYQYPNSQGCSNICWSSVSEGSSNATNIHFKRTCSYAPFDYPATTASASTEMASASASLPPSNHLPASHLPPNQIINIDCLPPITVASIPTFLFLGGGAVLGLAACGAGIYYLYSKYTGMDRQMNDKAPLLESSMK